MGEMFKTEPKIQLNNALDAAGLAKNYMAKRRIQIKDALSLDAAERIYGCLKDETPWSIVYAEKDKTIEIPPEELDTMTPQRQREIAMKINREAATGFQFFYQTYPLLHKVGQGVDQDLFIHRAVEFVNSTPFLDLVRTVTGIPEIIKTTAHACCYESGHFLTYHDDESVGQNRRAAYVLNFTKYWRPDWGGYLNFYDGGLNITDAFMPGFNELNIFTVPAEHSVGYVTPFAPAPRFSITGWFKDK